MTTIMYEKIMVELLQGKGIVRKFIIGPTLFFLKKMTPQFPDGRDKELSLVSKSNFFLQLSQKSVKSKQLCGVAPCRTAKLCQMQPHLSKHQKCFLKNKN